MRIAIRPSKTYLWSLLDHDLKKITGEIGVDAASAAFKSFPYFKTKQYFGIDISLDALKTGTTLYPETVGLNGSLADFDLPENSVDLVVSTNTLFHLDVKQRAAAIEKLCGIIKHDGCFLIELANDDFPAQCMEILGRHFKVIKKKYYGNFISQKYESFWEKDGFLGNHSIAGSKIFLLLSLILSKIEHITCHKSAGNTHVYMYCTEKKGGGTDNMFDISDKEKISERIYKI